MKRLNRGLRDGESLYWVYSFLWFILAFGWAIPLGARAQSAPTLAWVAHYNGPGNGLDLAIKTVTDPSGNVYVTGYSYNGVNYDYATVKYDANGNQLWVARYDNGSYDAANSLAVDAFGNVYVTGLSSNGLSYDYATVKYDLNGNQLWVARFINADSDFGNSLTVDGSGNVYVIGSSNAKYVTIKYDMNGNQLWAARYDNGSIASANSLAVDVSGNVYVTGYSYNDVNYDYATVKYDANGNQLWAARYDNGDMDSANSLAIDASGNVYVTGYSYNGLNSDYATVKYDANGNQLWVARYDNGGMDSANSLAVDASGNVYVMGSSSNGVNSDYATIKYDTNGNQLWVSRYDNGGYDYEYYYGSSLVLDAFGNVYVTGTSFNGLNFDYATIKYNSIGIQLWVIRYDSGFDDFASSLSVDASGNVYVAGESNGDYGTVKYVNLPDLVETNVTSPAIGTQLLPGSSISVTDTVANQGSASVGTFTVGIYLYPAATGEKYTFLGSRTVSSLAPGGSSTGTTTVKIPANVVGGTYDLQAVADYSNQIPESNETNNNYTNTSGVITIPPADLIMTSVSTTSTSVVRGGSVSLSYTVKNQGIGGASSFQIGFYLSTDNSITTGDKLLYYLNIKNGLNAGSSLSGTVTLVIPTTISPGTYYLGAYADYRNTVVESNESNNGLATSGTIQVQ